MNETFVKNRADIEKEEELRFNVLRTKDLDPNLQYVSVKTKKGIIVSHKWFADYVGASVWCLDNCR